MLANVATPGWSSKKNSWPSGPGPAKEKEHISCEYMKFEAGEPIIDDRNVDLELSWNVDQLD